MTRQLTWQTTPGVRGIACSRFRALKTQSPDNARGLAVTLGSDDEFESLLAELEMHFAAQRFADEAAALEAIRQYAFERANKKR
jgi:hypothetical protein